MKNNIIELDMFEVVCKCGHVGRSRYVEIRFPIKAKSGKDAARIAREFPRVKHDRKDAILNVLKIDQKRFFELTEMNNLDPYLHCVCIQDQNLIDISDRLQEEKKDVGFGFRKDRNNKFIYCGKRVIRDQKKYMNRYYFDDEEYGDVSA